MSTPHSTIDAAPPQASIYPAPFLVQPANLLIENCCLSAHSLLAHTVGGDAQYLIGLTCKSWKCRYCAATKIKRLSWLTRRAEPNRLLTLTVDPKLYDHPRQAFDRTRAFVPELIRSLRVRFGPIEYLRVTECTKTGWPHYHLLVRSGFLPHAVVKSEWNRLTGAQIVDLRKVDKAFGAYVYLTKYLTKMHNLDWTERHVSYSRQFFPSDPKEEYRSAELGAYEHVKMHPYEWLALNCLGQTLVQEAPLRWRLQTCPDSLKGDRSDGF